MKGRYLAVLLAGAATLGACTTTEEPPVATTAPVGPGAIAGTVAADRNGDGIVDGYYTPDGIYHAYQAPLPPPPPPPPPARPSGERG